MIQPCPACPDGNEWDSNGPTGRACKTCGGTAYIGDEDRTDAEDDEDQAFESYLNDRE